MLIGLTDIQAIRQVASNIDTNKIDIYIREAERLDLIPVIGAALYDRLTKKEEPIPIAVDDDGVAYLLTDNEEQTIAVGRQKDAEDIMLEGGGYVRCGVRRNILGVKVALSYFAYARLVSNHQVAVTPFGVVVKMGDDSNPAEQRTIASVANDARNIALSVLDECMQFWHDVEDCCCGKCSKEVYNRNGKRRFISIG